MLENRKWEHTAPEVPTDFHTRFEETLEILEQRNYEKRNARAKKAKWRVLLAAAAVCALCTATAAANEYFKWSETLKTILKPTEKQQEKLVKDGFVQGIGQSVTHSGVTITLKEAAQDRRSIYMLFDVETPENIILDDTAGFENGMDVRVDGKNIIEALDPRTSGSGGGGFVSSYKMKQESPHKKAYEVQYSFDRNFDFSGKTVTAVLENLTLGGDKAMDGEVAAEGTWEFRWNVGEVGSEKRFAVNESYDFGGYEIEIKYIDISPLGYVVYADYEDAMEVEKDERNTFTYTGDDPGLEVDARLFIRGVEYKDGTRIELEYGGGGGASPVKEEGVYKVHESFGRVIDVDNLETVIMMQGTVKVPLDKMGSSKE